MTMDVGTTSALPPVVLPVLLGFLGLLIGSVATQCVNHATVPVVVVPTAAAGD